MHVKTISLRHFRTYSRLELDLPAAPVLLLGANAQGKTSLLEAIAYLALGTSPFTNTDRHLINWQAVQAEMPFSHLKAKVAYQEHTEEIEIALERKTLSNGRARMSKRIKIDQKTVRRSDLAGHLNVVQFSPEDVALVSGSPSGRRGYLNNLLSQVYPAYVEALSSYRSAMSRRNALLRHLREYGGDPMQLAPLEEKLTETGVTISLYRRRLIKELSTHAARLHEELTGGGAWLQLRYEPSFDTLQPPALNYQIGLLTEARADPPVDVAELRDAYRETLDRRRRKEIERGVTLMGPHRDEVRFISNSVDLGVYGSRGQQRTVVLALHLAALRWLEQVTGESPVLLLDEVLAELDRARRGYLLALLKNVEQTILATTDAEMFPESFRRQTVTLRVAEGIITPVET